MRKRKHKKKELRPLIGAAIFIIMIILLVICIIRTDKALRPAAAAQAEHFARKTAEEAISESVTEYLAENDFSYSDFAAVLYDESGHPVSVEAIPVNINRVQSELTLLIRRKFSRMSDSVHRIPAGSLTGSYVLAGKGPDIKIKICPAEKISVRLKSTFDSAGINQTTHRISAVVKAEIKSALPIYSFDTEVEFEFLLAETVIIGDVPDYTRYAWSEI